MKGLTFTKRNVPKVQSGVKTQTRRSESGLPFHDEAIDWVRVNRDFIDARCKKHPFTFQFKTMAGLLHFLPQHLPGDKVYVRESLKRGPGGMAYYVSDDSPVILPGPEKLGMMWEKDDGREYKRELLTGRFMPQKAARTFLEITDVRCERLRSISMEDCKAEGVEFQCCAHPGDACSCDVLEAIRFDFFKLWDQTNGPGSAARNDWVIAYTYKLTKDGA